MPETVTELVSIIDEHIQITQNNNKEIVVSISNIKFKQGRFFEERYFFGKSIDEALNRMVEGISQQVLVKNHGRQNERTFVTGDIILEREQKYNDHPIHKCCRCHSKRRCRCW